MPNDLPTTLRDLLVDFLTPLDEAARTPATLARWLASLGHTDAVAADPALLSAAQHAQAVLGKLRAFDAAALESTDGLSSLLATGREVGAVVQELRAFASDPARSQFAGGLAEEVMAFLLASWLRRRHPTAFRVAALLTLVDARESAAADPPVVVNGVTMRHARWLDRFRFSAIQGLVRRPGATLRAAYLPNDLASGADGWAAAARLYPALALLADALGLAWRTEYGPNAAAPPPAADAPEEVPHGVERGDPDPEDPGPPVEVDDTDTGGAVSVPLPAASDAYYASNDPAMRLVLAGDAGRGALALQLLAASRKHPGGVAGLILQLAGDLDRTVTRGPWTLTFSGSGAVPALALGPNGLTRVPTTGSAASGAARLVVVRAPQPGAAAGAPAFLVGSARGTRLEIGTLGLTADVAFDASAWSASLALAASSGALVLAPADADGFLASLLPAGGLRAAFDLGLVWGSTTGLALRGQAGLSATVPVALSAGGVGLSSVQLALATDPTGALRATVSASLAAAIGPVRAAVDRVGIAAALTFPQGGGNLGVADLDVGFKPPEGVGLSVDAQGVLTGGGFVRLDPTNGVYSGVLQLSFEGRITLTAFGLITTKLPDGRPGWSLLIFITADGFQPVPLGFGFVLQRVGGMVGVHRTFDQAVLVAGLKTDTLSALLFPRDPVHNAPALLEALAGAFPAQRGSYLVGLLARLTWFSPTLVTIDLALVLELGLRSRLLVLARVSALLPSADDDLVRLVLDAVGVVDFDAGTLAVDAVLVDSRLVRRFPITGSAAVRARWTSPEDFVLAVGGLHPRFAAPAGFPTLERVAIALTSGKNPRLVCDAYLALTANTVQFGARASLYAEAAGFSVAGDLGFDALITLVPPHFVVDFHASVQLRRGSHNLFKVTIDGTLEGPLPLRIAARARFEILWFSFTVHFDFTLAAGDAARSVPPAVSLVDELARALADPASWTTQPPAGAGHGVALRPARPGGLVLDPLGQLVVKQQVAPLDTARDVTTYGGAPVAGDRRFHLAATLDGQATATPVSGPFAPARYFAMSDDAKLAAPSFEAMTAGLALGDPKASYGAVVPAPLSYLPITLAPAAAPAAAASTLAPAPATPPRYVLPVAAFARQRPTGAAARVPARRVGRARFRNPAAAPAARVGAPRWQIVRISDGSRAVLPPSVTTWSEHHAALAALNRGGVRWQLVPAHELTR